MLYDYTLVSVEPYVPYTVEVSSFTHAGEGIAPTESCFQKREVKQYHILYTGLLPGKEYCVKVAAQTNAGAGNFTKNTIPRELQL